MDSVFSDWYHDSYATHNTVTLRPEPRAPQRPDARGFSGDTRGVASGTEHSVASLAAKGLDRLSTPMLAIPDKCMEVNVGDPVVQTLLIGTSEALGGYPLGCSPAAFHLAPGAHRRRLYFRRGSGAAATGGAV